MMLHSLTCIQVQNMMVTRHYMFCFKPEMVKIRYASYHVFISYFITFLWFLLTVTSHSNLWIQQWSLNPFVADILYKCIGGAHEHPFEAQTEKWYMMLSPFCHNSGVPPVGPHTMQVATGVTFTPFLCAIWVVCYIVIKGIFLLILMYG